ncbi:MAG: Enamidase, partial [Desulfotomaculales bacterium]
MKTIALTNIGTVATGDVDQPLVQADTVIVAQGKIQKIGDRSLLKEYTPDETYDVGGMTVTPGLIDSHFHPVLGDYAPRQKTLDYIDSCLHGGVTTMISAGEAH